MAKLSTYDREINPLAEDLLTMIKASNNQNKRLQIGDLAAIIANSWVEISGLSYTSWDSTNKIGVMATSSDLTALFGVGARIRISQSTGGTKYFIVVAISSSSITGFFGTDYTLNNEAISASHYSTQKAPIGFPLNPAKWAVTTTSSSNRSTTSTSYASLTDAITLPIGAWRLMFSVPLESAGSGAAGAILAYATLSSSGTTETNPELTLLTVHNGVGTGLEAALAVHTVIADIIVAANTTFTMIGKQSGGGTASVEASTRSTIIRAVCAYL